MEDLGIGMVLDEPEGVGDALGEVAGVGGAVGARFVGHDLEAGDEVFGMLGDAAREACGVVFIPGEDIAQGIPILLGERAGRSLGGEEGGEEEEREAPKRAGGHVVRESTRGPNFA